VASQKHDRTPDDRRRIAAYGREHGSPAAAERFGVPASSVRAWMRGERLGDFDNRGRPTEGAPPAAPQLVTPHSLPEYVDKKTRKIDVDRAFALAIEAQELVGDMGTGQGELTVKIDTDRPVTWAPSSDWHLWSYASDHRAFWAYFQKILRTPHLYGSVHGDEIDNFQAGFRSAAAVFGQIFPPHVQKHLLAGIYEQLAEAGKILFRTWGNHVEDFDDHGVGGAVDRFNEIVPFLKHEGRVHLWVGGQEYKINTKHTFPGKSYLNANHQNKRAAREDWHEAQILVSGHTHRGAEWDRFWLGDRSILALVLPTFKTNCTYSLRYYGRSRVQEPAIVLFPKEHKYVWFDDLDTALEFADDQARRRTVHPVAA
jgi:hypothetical protein